MRYRKSLAGVLLIALIFVFLVLMVCAAAGPAKAPAHGGDFVYEEGGRDGNLCKAG